MTDRSRPGRALLGPALAICLLAAACSDEEPAPAAPAAEAVTETTTTTIAAVEQTTPLPPAADVLAEAVAALGTSYRFDSVITTGAGETVTVSGNRVDTSSSYSVEVGGAVLDVITVEDAVWIRQDGSDEWLESGENPPGDPLAPLAAPVLIARQPADPAVLVATYEATALGLDAEGTVDVQITVDAASVSFESVTEDISLVTTLTQDATLEPAAPPLTSP